ETSQVKIFYRYRYVSGLVSDLGEITIDITPINDAPTFTASNVSLRGAATDGLVELDNWLENPSVSGGDDEASQTLSTSVAIVGKSDTIQFITPPAVLANGRLSFEAATGSQGICEIAVTLSDNGGTANGGIDSITQNYTLRFGVVLANPLASGTNNGDSWDNAFTSFASAVANAQVGEQVWLAEGRYPCNGATLKNQVEIYGGFTPSMFSLGERDWNTHRAILTGDLGGDDIDTDGNGIAESASDFVGGNSQRVIVTNGLQRSAVLDGATITAASGNFGSSPLLGAGGGIVCDFNSSPTLRNLDVVGNRGNWGGGLAVFSGNPLLVNCQFRNNVAGDGLGNAIVFLGYSNPARGQLVNCRFLKNGSSGSVIGHTNGGGSVGLTQCEFFGFPANGTMVYHNGSSTASFAFSQCTFVGNGNQWFSGSALSNIERSILSGFATNGETLNSCLVTGAVVDGTQIVSNQPPAFLDQDGPDNLLGTPDDDFSLSPSSPALDWFAPTVLPADIADLDGDADMAESIPLDIAGQPRVDIYGKRLVDLGAREFTLANAEVDVDKDGLPDGFEFAYSGSRTGLAPTSDLDNDRANALLEFFRGTSPSHADVPNAGVETSYGGLEGLEGNWLTYTVLQDPRSKDYVGGGPKIRDDLSNLGLAIIPVGMVSSSSETAVGIYHTLRFRPDLQAQDKLFIRYEVNRINVGDPEE
ncbi:MAG: Ig-like domain-containing protein, partial [Akkermansiaceae bacterium]